MKKGMTLGERLAAKERQRMANTTLGEEDVQAIRAAVGEGRATVGELADLYGISPDSVRKIVKRERFRWVKDAELREDVAEMGRPDSPEILRIMELQKGLGAGKGEGESQMESTRELTETEKRAAELGVPVSKMMR